MKKKYSEQFKMNAIKQVIENGRMVKEVAQELDLAHQTLYRWLKIYRENGKPPGSERTKVHKKKYIQKLEIENKILKRSRFLENDTDSIFEFIHQHKSEFAISTMCDLLQVSSSGYYKWAKNITSDEERKHKFLLRKTRNLYIKEWPNVGSPRLTRLLHKQGISTSQPTIARIIKKNKESWHTNYAELHSNKDVVLHFPTKNYTWDIKNKRFYHEDVNQKQIDNIRNPRSFMNVKKYDRQGIRSIFSFKDTDNLIIKSENLIALHTLKSRFKSKVKLIYIDPPYNTKNTHLSYKDSLSRPTYLTFLKNRLDVAKELLKADGSIFIHCNDHEQAYIKVLCDEIFGGENFINQIVWKRTNAQQNRGKMANVKDYIIIFAKNKNKFHLNKLPLSKNSLGEYKYKDTKGSFRLDKIADKRGYYTYEIKTDEGKRLNNKWIYPKDTFQRLLNNNEIYWSKSGYPYKKVYLEDNTGQLPIDFWDEQYGTNREAVQELKMLFNDNIFTHPKPERLLKNIIDISTDKRDIVLDFFLGSGTTAAVAHKMNRQYIGIEQSDYINTISVPRLIKVIEGHQSGISIDVEWQGNGSFVYAEIKQ